MLGIAAAAAQSQTQSQSQPQVLFDNYAHDFGHIREVDGVVEHIFSYTNHGKEPFVITAVSVGCGCTTPAYSIKALAAGASEKFSVRFDPTDRPGRFEKEVFVRSNQGNLKLAISGVVEPRPRTLQDDYPYVVSAGVRLAALAINLENAVVGRPMGRVLRVANGSATVGATISVDSTTLPPWLKVDVRTPFLKAGERGEIIFIFNGTQYGFDQTDVTIRVNGEIVGEKIWVSATFTRDFSGLSPLERRDGAKAELSSYFYHFSDRKLGEKLSRTFEIRNTGKADLVIDRVQSSADDLTFTLDRQTVKAGEKAVLSVKAAPKVLGTMSETITIISNDPANPVREVRVMANVI